MHRSVQVGKGALLSCAKGKGKSGSESKSKSTRSSTRSTSPSMSKSCDSDAKLWSAIKRTLDKEAIAKIAGLVDAQNTPTNPVHHPSVQSLRKELRLTHAVTPTLTNPFFKTFMVEHRGQTYTVEVTIRENGQAFMMMKGKPGALGSTVVKPKILAHFSHSVIRSATSQSGATSYYSEANIDMGLCSDDQEKLFYAVMAAVTTAVLTGKHLKTVNLDRVKVHLTGIGTSRYPIMTLRERVRELFEG